MGVVKKAEAIALEAQRVLMPHTGPVGLGVSGETGPTCVPWAQSPDCCGVASVFLGQVPAQQVGQHHELDFA